MQDTAYLPLPAGEAACSGWVGARPGYAHRSGMAISYERPRVGYTAVMPTLSWRDEHSQVGEGEGEGGKKKAALHAGRVTKKKESG